MCEIRRAFAIKLTRSEGFCAAGVRQAFGNRDDSTRQISDAACFERVPAICRSGPSKNHLPQIHPACPARFPVARPAFAPILPPRPPIASAKLWFYNCCRACARVASRASPSSRPDEGRPPGLRPLGSRPGGRNLVDRALTLESSMARNRLGKAADPCNFARHGSRFG